MIEPIDYLVGKTITMARYEKNTLNDVFSQVLTVHFDDDTLWGLTPDRNKLGALVDTERCVPFEEADAMSERGKANYEANVKGDTRGSKLH